MEKQTGFCKWVQDYDKTRELFLEGREVEEIREMTGLEEECVEKYTQIVSRNYLIIKGE